MARGITAVDLRGFEFYLTPITRNVRCGFCRWGASLSRSGNALGRAAQLKAKANAHAKTCEPLKAARAAADAKKVTP